MNKRGGGMAETGGAIAAAIRFLPLAWRSAAPAIAVAIVAGGLCGAAGVLAWIGRVVLALAVVSVAGALWRLASGVGRPGRRGVQLGRPEARLLASALLRAAFLAIIFLLAFIVVLAFAYGGASAGRGFVASDVRTWAGAADARGKAFMALGAIAGAAFWLWAQARTALAAAATAARGKVQVLSTWPLTRGRVVSVLLVQLACAVATAPVLAAASGLRGWAAGLVATAGVVGLWLPLTSGAGAYLYRASECEHASR